jgi:hypothetical protein
VEGCAARLWPAQDALQPLHPPIASIALRASIPRPL